MVVALVGATSRPAFAEEQGRDVEPAQVEGTRKSNGAYLSRGGGAPLIWEPRFRRFDWTDGVIAGVSLGFAGLFAAMGPDVDDPNRTKLEFDEDVRDAVRSDDYTVRRTWRDLSDSIVVVNIAYPFVSDALVNAAWYRDSPDVAWQLALIDGEALALTLGIQQVVANSVSRERPYGRTCGTSELSETNDDCEDVDRYRSFFSGHASLSFTAASATCTHHAYLPLHGGKAEWVPCAAGLAFAALTGFARIGADMHYATDVLTGAAVGSVVGWFVPWLHYTTGSGPEATKADTVTVFLLPRADGLQLSGAF